MGTCASVGMQLPGHGGSDGQGVGQRGAGNTAEAEGSRLSPAAERRMKSPCVAAVGPGSCQPWGEPGWPRAASHPPSQGWERVSPTPESTVLGVTACATQQPHTTSQGTWDAPVPALPAGFALHPGPRQPSPQVPLFLLLCPCEPGPSVTQEWSETSDGHGKAQDGVMCSAGLQCLLGTFGTR